MSAGTGIPFGSVEEQEHLNKFRKNVAYFRLKLLNENPYHLNYRQSLSKQKEMVKALTFAYCKQLLDEACVLLRNGVNRVSVLSELGLWTASMILSNDFSLEVPVSVVRALKPMVDSKALASGKNSVWQNRMRRPDAFVCFGLIPDTAGLIRILFTRQAYVDMRDKKKDRSFVLDDYREAERDLYQFASSFGIVKESLDKSVRIFMGELIPLDKRYASLFSEIAYDVVFRGDDSLFTKAIRSGGSVKKAEYSCWDGVWLDRQGNRYTGGFSLRVPLSVNQLRRMSAEAWYRFFSEAVTLDDWKDLFEDSHSFEQPWKYLLYIKEDNYLKSSDLGNLNRLLKDDDDIGWMFFYDGDDPFAVGSLDDSFLDIQQNGIKPDSDLVVPGAYPEYKVGLCRWINAHADQTPMGWQQKINQAYRTYVRENRLDDAAWSVIYQYVTKRDACKEKWMRVFDSVRFENLKNKLSMNERTMSFIPPVKARSEAYA